MSKKKSRHGLRLKPVWAIFWMLWICLGFSPGVFSNPDGDGSRAPVTASELEQKVLEWMEDGKIPGLTLVIVRDEVPVFVRSYGYADLEKKVPVKPTTRFELGSCSKAFTALAALRLEKEGLIRIDDPVSRHLPWFSVTHEGKKYDITIRQLLHHTSGIPWKTISYIPLGGAEDALEQTAKNINGIELNDIPGLRYEYATVNYDIVGHIIEKVAGMSFEDYVVKNVLRPLGLNDSTVGIGGDIPLKATGYKIGFYAPREYDAPVYRGNNPAGYVVSNGKDMARWLQLQLGLEQSGTLLDSLIRESHRRDRRVPIDRRSLSAYSMGWQVYLEGSDYIDHGGLNPNFTAYLGFSPGEKLGVAVLANSDSAYTNFIGRAVMDLMRGKEESDPPVSAGSLDKSCSLVSFIMAFYLLCVIAFIVSVLLDIIKGRRRFEPLTPARTGKLLLNLLLFVPFVLGVYFLPRVLADFTWKPALVWSPLSFQVAVLLLLGAMALTYLGSVFSALFPMKNKYIKSIPLVIVLSLLSGGANAVVIFLITGALFSTIPLFYQVYYFGLAFFVYIVGRKVLQTKLVRLTFDIVYDMRIKLVDKVFLTSYQKFEKLERGRVYATLNDDTGQIGNSANILVQLVTSVITTIGAFVYLATIAFWATMVTLFVVAVIATLYAVVSQRAQVYLEEARDTRNVYMGLLNGLLDGFRELSLHFNKKKEYEKDVEHSCDEFRNKTSTALIKFVNAFLIGESLLLIVLGAVGFAIPRLFPDMSTFTLMSFIIVLLYLIGPVNGILNSIPAIMQLKVAWGRVTQFMGDIPANIDPKALVPMDLRKKIVESIKAAGLEFKYESENEDEQFAVGPIDLEGKQGEIIFIIGGNGSGKTTLAMLLTGLYHPHKGVIHIDGKRQSDGQIGEYFSAVFDNFHLFEKLYNVDLLDKEGEIQEYLKLLRLQDKVSVKEETFSTIDLSGGQKKRLALLQCYLEDCPIYLFDEVAADQDPEFRRFFYRDLLQRMKEQGKIVIAITHDDHYFDVADKIIKLDMGKIEYVDASYKTTR